MIKATKETRPKGKPTLSSPDTAQSLGDTNIVSLELVQADSGGKSECAKEPVAESTELGHT